MFSRARHERFRESDALRRVFERVVGLCIAAGLVGGEAFSIDASLIKADVDKKKRVPGDQPIEWPTPEEASHAVREYLAALDAARRDEESGGGDGGGSSNSGGGKPPKEISLTDPQAAWVARKGVDPFFAYDANYLIDNKFGIILDADGTRANRTDEMAIAETMMARVERRFDLKPERLAGDTAYGAAKLLKWLWDRGITPHVPVWDKSAQIRRQVQPGRLRLRQGAQCLHLSGRGRTHALGDRRSGAHSSLSGEHERLLDLQAQAQVHDGARPQGLARHRRGRARAGACPRQHRSLPAVMPRAQESRGEVRAYEAHPQTRPASAARLERREGRGAADRHGAEPEAARQAHMSRPATGRRCVRRRRPVASSVGAKASTPPLRNGGAD